MQRTGITINELLNPVDVEPASINKNTLFATKEKEKKFVVHSIDAPKILTDMYGKDAGKNMFFKMHIEDKEKCFGNNSSCHYKNYDFNYNQDCFKDYKSN